MPPRVLANAATCVVAAFARTRDLSRRQKHSADLLSADGIGLGYAVTEQVGLRMEYEVARHVGEEIEGDMKALFFSVQYRF